jgi:hypothetical protein
MTDSSVSDAEGHWDVDRAHRTGCPINRLACLAAILLGLATLTQPNLAAAAAGKGRGDTALPAARGPSSDGREPARRPASETVVLRGTLPTRPDAGPPPPGDSGDEYAAPDNEAFQPERPYGSGWDLQYDYSGLSGTYWGPQ